MKRFLVIFVLFCFISVQAQIYQKYTSLADPLYSPWLTDQSFICIDKQYLEPHAPGAFRDGRYLEYALARAALSCKSGDFIECGVFTGKSLDIFAGVLDMFDSLERHLFGFDSFQGLDNLSAHDIDIRTSTPFFSKGSIRGWDLEVIKKGLSHRKCKIELIEGWIPYTFKKYENKTFAFAHIDVDLYQATLDSLAFIYPRMVSGGIILFDDYGFPMCTGARKAVDQFLNDKQECLIPLPSGQAFLIKK